MPSSMLTIGYLSHHAASVSANSADVSARFSDSSWYRPSFQNSLAAQSRPSAMSVPGV